MPTSPVDAHLGARLQQLREQRDLSMSQVGRGIGTTYQQVRKYETGQNRISAATLFRLAQLLNFNVSVFFEGLSSQGGKSPHPISSAPMIENKDDVLSSIEDPDVRQHLSGLLRALGAKS